MLPKSYISDGHSDSSHPHESQDTFEDTRWEEVAGIGKRWWCGKTWSFLLSSSHSTPTYSSHNALLWTPFFSMLLDQHSVFHDLTDHAAPSVSSQNLVKERDEVRGWFDGRHSFSYGCILLFSFSHPVWRDDEQLFNANSTEEKRGDSASFAFLTCKSREKTREWKNKHRKDINCERSSSSLFLVSLAINIHTALSSANDMVSEAEKREEKEKGQANACITCLIYPQVQHFGQRLCVCILRHHPFKQDREGEKTKNSKRTSKSRRRNMSIHHDANRGITG